MIVRCVQFASRVHPICYKFPQHIGSSHDFKERPMHTTPSLRTLSLLTTLGLCSSLVACKGASDAPPNETQVREDGSAYTSINANDKENWVRFDLDEPDALEPGDGWDLSFRRQKIRIHDEAGVAIALIDNKTLAEVEGRPQDDAFFGDTSDEDKDLAFSQSQGWYDYSLITHTLSPRLRTYVVRSSEGRHFKLQFLEYYDDEGRPGFPAFAWEALDGDTIIDVEPEECVVEDKVIEVLGEFDEPSDDAPYTFTRDDDGVIEATLDASLGGPAKAAESAYIYIDLSSAAIVALGDREARMNSVEWDIAVKRSVIRVNSADSGPGEIVVIEQTDADFMQATPPSPDDEGWLDDDIVSETCEVNVHALDFLKTAFGQWYDYDFDTHEVSVREDVVHFVRDRASGEQYAFQILTYDDGAYTLRWRQVEP